MSGRSSGCTTIERANHVWAADITSIPNRAPLPLSCGDHRLGVIERLWRSLKSEDVYLKGCADGRKAARGIAEWVAFYNERRPHQALADRTPMAVWREANAGPKAVDLMDNAAALPSCPQADQEQQQIELLAA